MSSSGANNALIKLHENLVIVLDLSTRHLSSPEERSCGRVDVRGVGKVTGEEVGGGFVGCLVGRSVCRSVWGRYAGQLGGPYAGRLRGRYAGRLGGTICSLIGGRYTGWLGGKYSGH